MFTRVTQGIILHGLFNAGKFHTTFKLDRRPPLSKKKKKMQFMFPTNLWPSNKVKVNTHGMNRYNPILLSPQNSDPPPSQLDK